MASGRYLEGFVVHNSEKSGAFYAWCAGSDRDFVIDYREWSANTTLLGKWVEFTASDGFHARDVRVLEDRFESRVRKAIGVNIGEIRVDIFYDSRHNQIDIFHHDYIGYVCDSRHVIGNVDRDRKYSVWVEKNSDRSINCRWKVSELAENHPTYSGPSHRNTSRASMCCSGIIHSYNMTRDKFIAWTPSYPRSTITIDFSHCPRGEDMIGRWVDITVDDKKRVVDDVFILQDKFQTRVKGSVFEINCKFQNIQPRDGDNYEMFHNDYFGNICDAKEVLSRPERRAWYRGWIVYHRQDGVDARWRIATRQDVEGPLNDSRDDYLPFRYEDNRSHSRQRYDSRNSDRYSPIQNHRQRSPDRRSPSPIDDYPRRRYDPHSPDRPIPDNSRPPSHQNTGNARRRKVSDASSAVSRAPTSDSEGDEWDQVGSSDEGQKQNNRSHQPSSRTLSTNADESRAASVAKKTVAEVPPWNPHANVSTQPTSSIRAIFKDSKKAPEEDKNFRKLQTWAGRLAECFEDFTANEEVNEKMRVHCLELHEEGLEMAKKIKGLISDLSK